MTRGTQKKREPPAPPRVPPSPLPPKFRRAVRLELEPQRLPDERQRLEDAVERPGGADLVRVAVEQHRCVNGGSRLLRRQLLELAFADQRVHVAKEFLGTPSRPNAGDDLCRLIAAITKRVGGARRYARGLAGRERRPRAVLEHVQRSLENLEALLGVGVYVGRRPRHSRIEPIRGLEQGAGGVFGAFGDLPSHAHARMEVELAVALLESRRGHASILALPRCTLAAETRASSRCRPRGPRGHYGARAAARVPKPDAEL